MMAHRMQHGQGVSKLSSFNDEIGSSYPPTTTTITPTPPPDGTSSSSSSSSASSLAAKAIRASSAYRDSSLSSAYGQSALSCSRQRGDSNPNPSGSSSLSSAKKLNSFEYTSIKGLNEPKHGFWGTLARKAKAILDDDNSAEHIESPKETRMQMRASEHVESPRRTKMQMPAADHIESPRRTRMQMPAADHIESPRRTKMQMPAVDHIESPRRTRMQMPDIATRVQQQGHSVLSEGHQKSDNPSLQKRLDAIASSFTYIGGTIGNVLEEGITIVENRTADIIQETRKLQLRRKGSGNNVQIQGSNALVSSPQPQMHTPAQPRVQADLDIQLKASRDVAMAMAAKAKLLLRELKTVKADLAFAKERCAQLEDENRILRESEQKGENPADDDLIRHQLETLLAEKARLAQENSVFARENRFLREIVEYHQLTMQDVVYLDEGNEEVQEVFPIRVPSVTDLHSLSTSSPTSSSGPHVVNLQVAQGVSALPVTST